MYRPYTDRFPEAVAIASECVAVTLTAVIWSRPLRTRAATWFLVAAVWIAALCPLAIANILQVDPSPNIIPLLQTSATLATVAAFLHTPRWFGALAILGQVGLLSLSLHVRESNYELIFAHLFWYGILLGVHALRVAAPTGPSSCPPAPLLPSARLFRRHDIAIFLATTGLALMVTNLVFGRVIYNGDEVANTFQADVYGHLRAYAPLPPCASMFENYWVFRRAGRAFSQYTPGWPLFMAPFQRLGIIWLAGPVMAGIAAVGVARLSRRIASGLGTTPERSRRIVGIAGVLGAIFAMLGPSMLLNGASRFSHTMVCACFAWAVESMCVVSDSDVSRGSAWRHGLLLGATTSLGLATRPADGGTLGVGVFLYFVWALLHRRMTWRAFAGTTVGFLFFGGLTLVILRLQLGAWFQTGYALAAATHSEAQLHLSWPRPSDMKNAIPIATGSHTWWPAAPAVGIAGLIRALGGPERRVAFMLATSGLALLGFYFLVEFGRWADEGLGPRYYLPLVVAMAAGGAGIVAPVIERMNTRRVRIGSRIRLVGPGILIAIAVAYGVIRIAPLTYPLAHADYKYSTAPFRAAKRMRLKNAVVMIEPGRGPAHETNLAQNAPMEKNPDVLFLIRRSESDEACVRQNFPGRTWYRGQVDDTLPRY
jgi:hypothetical protein